jgi:RING finger protein 113A
VPFACFICRKPYTDPVATRCGHYFCSACAIKRFARTPKCATCLAPTGGIFNRADKVLAKMRQKRADRDERRQEAAEAAGGVLIEGLAAPPEKEKKAESSSSSSSSDEDEE